MTTYLVEAQVEIVTVGYVRELSYECTHGPIIAPRKPIVNRFDQMVGPIDQQIEICKVRSLRLAGRRDTLLPKLLSGEIRISSTETLVEGVV